MSVSCSNNSAHNTEHYVLTLFQYLEVEYRACLKCQLQQETVADYTTLVSFLVLNSIEQPFDIGIFSIAWRDLGTLIVNSKGSPYHLKNTRSIWA